MSARVVRVAARNNRAVSTPPSIAVARTLISRARAATSEICVHSLMADACHELGFRHYALLHHIDPLKPRAGQVLIENYPEELSQEFIARRFYQDDPAVHASLRTNAAFCWSEIPDIIQLTSRHRTILDWGVRAGLSIGLTVPACIVGEWTGSCSLIGNRRSSATPDQLMLAQVVGAFAFQAARRIANGGALTTRRRPTLNRRQLECTILAGRGKSDWEIAAILKLSPVTITHYLAEARARYDVVTRQQLVICALLDGQISLAELSP